jgi:hypothetical protein
MLFQRYFSGFLFEGQLRKVPPTDDYRITAPTTTFYDLYQWLYMQFLELLMMGAKCSRNMWRNTTVKYRLLSKRCISLVTLLY